MRSSRCAMRMQLMFQSTLRKHRLCIVVPFASLDHHLNSAHEAVACDGLARRAVRKCSCASRLHLAAAKRAASALGPLPNADSYATV